MDWSRRCGAAGQRVPMLGICVGMQILFDQSEEFGLHPGLGLVPGEVRRLPDPAPGRRGMRVPNVGWRALCPRVDDPVLGDLAFDTMTYFVHSYAVEPKDAADIAATIEFNGRDVVAAIHRGNIMGFQFHPEKSGEAGIALIRRFLDFSPGLN